MSERDYNKCVDRYSDMIFGYFVKNLSEGVMAEDLVQDTFLALWQNHEGVEFEKAKAYLFITAHNRLVNANKDIAKQQNLKNSYSNEQTSSFEAGYYAKNQLDLLCQRLKPELRECLILKDIQGFSYQEIAQIMNITLPSVKTNIFRARVQLKQMLINDK